MTALRTYRYEDGDAEHLQWTELKEILLALPAQEGDADVATPAVTTKPNKRVAATIGNTCTCPKVLDMARQVIVSTVNDELLMLVPTHIALR